MNGPFDMMQAFRAFMANPGQMLMQRGLNVPPDVASDPNRILQYLLNTGQISQDQVDEAYRQSQMLRR